MLKKLMYLGLLACTMTFIDAQRINLGKVLNAGAKGVKALSFSNADAARLSKESVDWMDKNNPVADKNSPYTKRLNRLFGKHKNQDGLDLNYKVYLVKDINAFAAADGSVRVFSSLMDIMNDDELLAIIGHEIGHVKNEDTKDAIKSAYTRAALLDAASSASNTVTALSESQIGAMANSFLSSSHSRKQESQADDYSYEFMKKHNYNVVGAYTAFKKLEILAGNAKQNGFERMFNSHPDSGKRAEAIKKKAEKDGLWKDPGTVSLPTSKLPQK